MGKKLGPALVLLALLVGGVARAAPLTGYNNEAAWLAAVSDFNVAPYTDLVTGFENFVTVRLYPNNTCCILSDRTSSPVTSFKALDATFSLTDIDNGGPLTYTSEISIQFSTPIYGFASLDAHGDLDGPLSGIPTVDIVNGFYGVVGYISSLDITGNNLSDDQSYFTLNDIVVAVPADEPSTLATVAVGLVLLSFLRFRVRRKGG